MANKRTGVKTVHRNSHIPFVIAALLITASFSANAIGEKPSPYETGWRIQTTSATDWISIEGNGTLTQSSDRFTAFIPAGSKAAWALTTEPIWVYRFSVMRMRFRASGIANTPERPLLSLQPGSTGPVTPGAANMENPFARAGAKTITLTPEQLASDAIQTLTVRVRPPIQTEQIDRIVLSLESAGRPAALEIFDLSFVDPPAGERREFSLENLSALPDNADTSQWWFPLLPASESTLGDIVPDTISLPQTIQCAEIPFQLSETQTLVTTSFCERDTLTIPIGKRCSEVFLLLAANIAGTDDAFRFVPRNVIDLPERLIVSKHYADGRIDQSFPYNLNRGDYIVDATPFCAYVIPIDPERVLERIVVEEFMSYGQVFLAGITVHAGPTPIRPIREQRWPVSLPHPESETSQSPVQLTVEENRRFILQNDFYLLEIDAEGGGRFTRLLHKQTGRNLLNRPAPIFSLMAGGLPVSSDCTHLASHQTTQRQLTLEFQVDLEPETLSAALTIQASTDFHCAMQLRLENPGFTPQFIRLRFPNLQEMHVGESASEDYYLFPRKRAALDYRPVELNGVHSGEFPLQFMDLYSTNDGAGFAIHTRDLQQVLKRFRYEKTAVDSRMAVDYGFFKPIELKSKETFTTPTTLFEFHAGDWHAPFETYQSWVRTWYRPNPQARNVLKNVFVCRRDYPIGGTGYLFDPIRNSYTFHNLIEESRCDLGGVDMIDISGWAYSEEFGRVGEYRRYELGGLEDFHRGIAESHRLNVPVGLYTEGYLLDPRSVAGREQGHEWQIVDAEGKPKFWQGNQEMFMCPYADGWRRFLTETLTNVAEETGADAVYTDQYGFADAGKACYSTAHGHEAGVHPLQGEFETLKTIRKALDRSPRPVALYTEQVPNDLTSQYTDAAFDYALSGTRSFQSPAKLNLFRFAFPTFKVIQLFHPGIDPKGISAEDAKLCFFYGEAMWLKGRARSWYSRECRAFIRKAYHVFHDHVDAFISTDVEPFIPTLQPGVFANRFSSDKETIVTLYNADYHTVRGPLLAIANTERAIEDVWGIQEFSVKVSGNANVVFGTLEPREVGCLSIRSSSSRE